MINTISGNQRINGNTITASTNMATWISSEGSLGRYRHSNTMSVSVFAEASRPLGTVRFVLAKRSKLPNGKFTLVTTNPSDDTFELTISGIPSYVESDTDYEFTIDAIERINGVDVITSRNFSITVTTTTWITKAGSIGTYVPGVSIDFQFEAVASDVFGILKYSLLNGNLPAAMTDTFEISEDGKFTGVTGIVNKNTVYNFTIRVTESDVFGNTIGVRDRAFSLGISGIDDPSFITNPGVIIDTLDSKRVEFAIEYYVPENDPSVKLSIVRGSLPPGLSMNERGLISGFPRPPAEPSVDYSFTVQMIGIESIIRARYTITVRNQESDPSWQGGRVPTLLNDTVVPQSDPYYQYHYTGTNIGSFTHANLFIFKFIGYDFDGDQISYNISGLENVLLGSRISSTDGWINGTLPNVGNNIKNYDFTVQVYKTLNPLIASDVYYLTLTVIGNVATGITWNTPSSLGTIRNGDVSIFGVGATYENSDDQLEYKIVGKYFDDDLHAIVGSAGYFTTAGLQGGIFNGSLDADEWKLKKRYPGLKYYGAAYSDELKQTVLIGGDAQNQGTVTVVTESVNDPIYSNLVISNSKTLRHVIKTGDQFIAVGDSGGIYTSISPDVWTTSLAPTIGGDNLRGIAYSGSRFVAVGDNSTILHSADGQIWTLVPRTSSIYSFNGITWTGQKFIAVGNYGVIASSDNGLLWSFSSYGDISYNRIASNGSIIIVVGGNGEIINSLDGGRTWRQSTSGTTNDLYDIYYNSANEPGYVDQFITSSNMLITGLTINDTATTSVTVQYVSGVNGDILQLAPGDASKLMMFMNLTSDAPGEIRQDPRSGYLVEPDAVDGSFPPYIIAIDTVTDQVVVSHGPQVLTNRVVQFSKPAHTGMVTDATVRWYMNSVRLGGLTSKYHTSLNNIKSSFTFYDLGPKTRRVLRVVGTTLYLDNVDKLSDYMNVTGDSVVNEILPGRRTKPPKIIKDGINVDKNSVTLSIDQTIGVTRPRPGSIIQFNKPVYTSLISDTTELINWIAVGDAGTILTSTDGIIWNSPTLGTLPLNLKLLRSGNIVGRLAFESTNRRPHTASPKRYDFRVLAYSSRVPDIRSTKNFTLTTEQAFDVPYDNVYIKALMNNDHRNIVSSLLNDNDVIPNHMLYRPDDQYFGKAKNVTYQHMFGIPSAMTEDYISAQSINHYWRHVVLGELKTAVARDDDNNVIYEVVYSRLIDNLVNNKNVSISKQILWPTEIEYHVGPDVMKFRELSPNSLFNMKTQVEFSLGTKNDSKLLPHWMRTQQLDGSTLGFSPAWVICYTKPGYSLQVVENIKRVWPYVLNQVEFEMDRFEIDRSLTYDYIPESNTWESLPSAQPFPVILNSRDEYIMFPQRNILL